MASSRVRVLIVEDYEPWARFVLTNLKKYPGLQIVFHASDGIQAVQKAEELKPDLVLLDIGLDKLNGLEVARRIRKISPNSKILFASAERSMDVVEEALSTGANGYIAKTDAATELLPAVEAVLRGKSFVSSSVTRLLQRMHLDFDNDDHSHQDQNASLRPQNIKSRHEVEFYSDDVCFVEGFCRVIDRALQAGSTVIVIATESHRTAILQKLTNASEFDAALDEGRYSSLDAADTVASLMVEGMPDPTRCSSLVESVMAGAAKRTNRRIVICGECAPWLLEAGDAEGAIRLEHLWDEITVRYDTDTLCGYVWRRDRPESDAVFQRICAEHSAIQARALGY